MTSRDGENANEREALTFEADLQNVNSDTFLALFSDMIPEEPVDEDDLVDMLESQREFTFDNFDEHKVERLDTAAPLNEAAPQSREENGNSSTYESPTQQFMRNYIRNEFELERLGRAADQ